VAKLWMPQPGRVEELLAAVPLLSELGPQARSALAAATTVHSFEVGETIIREGDPADALFVVLKGTVRAVSAAKGGRAGEVSLNKLTAGDLFGEVGLVERSPRTATCRAAGEEPAFVLRIAGAAVEPVVAAHPKLRERILELGHVYRAWNFLKVSTPLAETLTPEQLRAFVGILELRSFAKDAEIVAAGDAAAPFLIVRSGFVRLETAAADGQSPPKPTVLGEGHYSGEAAILAGEPAPCRVRAAADEVLAFVASRRDLARFLETAPTLRKFLELNPCRPIDASLVPPAPRSFNVWDKDPTVYLGLEAVPQRASSPAATAASSPASAAGRGPIFRFPLVRQHDASDCGAAALAMVARFHGKRVGIGRIRDLARASERGASLAGIAEAAEALGFRARGVRVSASAVDRHALPAIAVWEKEHFVVLYRIDARSAWVADPAVGLRRLTRDEFDRAFGGTLLGLEPTERLAGVRAAKGGLGRLVEQLSPFRRTLVEIALASLAIDVLALGGPLATQAIIDRALPAADVGLVGLLIGGLAVAALFRIVTAAVRAHLIANLTLQLDLRILVKFFAHVLSLPLAFFRWRRPGEVLSRFAENEKARSLLSSSLVVALLDLLLVTLTVVVLGVESLKLTLAALALVPVSATVALAFAPLIRARSDRIVGAAAEQEAALVDTLGAVETVKAFALESSVRWRWEARYARYLRAVYDAAGLDILLGSATDALGTASSLVILGYGAVLVIRSELTIGQLVAFQALLATILAPIGNLATLWDRIQEATLALERIDSVLDCEPEEIPAPSALLHPRTLLEGRIRFDRVFFRYAPEAPFALEDLSLEIGAGTTVGILGRSGAGKTTAARLLLKLDRPTEGRVTFDDLDLGSISAQGLRRAIGYVPEDVHLFQGTIAEYVAAGSDEPDRAGLEEAARLAEAHGFVSALPHGYETLLGEGGLGLSGGQRQRLALARALYPRPRILVLDEATQALDLDTEARVFANLRASAAGRTTIIFSNRASAVRHADWIVVLEKGRLVQDGTHEELAAGQGLYRELMER
jgi:ATP-binding cassette subfamily B protein